MKRVVFVLLVLVGVGTVLTVSDSASPDTDNDGILDSLDACPQIPAKNKADGCPVFQKRIPSIEDVSFLIPSFLIADKVALDFRQKTELRFNDEISAVLYDPKTGEVFSKSNIIKVRN